MSATQVSNRTPGFLQGLFLLLPITLAVIGVSVFSVSVPMMQAHFRNVTWFGSPTIAGSPAGDYMVNLLQTMPGFWIVAFSPVAGWLADKFGRRTILLWSMVIYAVAGTAPYVLDEIYTILFTRCLVGMCESVILTITTTMLCDYFKGAARERWLASQTGTASLSALVIIPLGGILAGALGWHGPFLVYLYSLLLFFFVLIFCWEPPHEAPDAAEIAKVDSEARYQTMPWARMVGIILITVVASVMFYSTITQNANAFLALKLDPSQLSFYMTVASLGVPIGTVLFWGLARLHIGLLLFIDFMLIGTGFTWMSMATPDKIWGYVFATNLQQIGCGLVLPTLLVWATRGLAYRIRGRGNGLWQGAFGIGLFISGATLTFLGSHLGGLIPAFGVLGKVCFVAAAIAIVSKLIWGRNALPASAADKPALH
ncbi:MAG TPA: MFS transporter [Steroidobacteraceae bacterium]|nr:MFS transporter [Steroidobacteraceae bacterium]